MNFQIALVFSALWILGDELPHFDNAGGVKDLPKWTFNLTQDLTLGPENGDAYIWIGSNVAVVPDKDGKMYVLNEKENQVLVLDPQGNILKTIGGPGDGPGEFRKLRTVSLLPDGGLIAFENAAQPKLSFFDASHNFVERKTYQPNMRLITATFSPDGRFAGSKALVNNQKQGVETNLFVIVDKEMNPVETILKVDGKPLDVAKMEDPNYWVEFLSTRFKVFSKGLNGYVGFSPDGSTYTALAHTYSVTKWDKNMKPLFTFSRQYKPVFQSEEEINAVVDPIRENILSQLPPRFNEIITRSVFKRAVDKAGFAPNRNPIAGLMVMENGNVVVAHHLSYLTGEAEADVFSPKGVYLGSFKAPHFGMRLSRMKFMNGYAYTIENREDDENLLVRYKVSISK